MNTNEKLFSFIKQSPTGFHAVDTMSKTFLENGYVQLLEGAKWEIQKGGKYFVTRNGSAIIAFRVPEEESAVANFKIMASHSDSPMFKIKENPEMEVEGHYVKLNVEKYGGMLAAPWFDRPLSVAGRLVVKTENGIESKLIDADRDLLMIPNLAIHMNREVNDGYKYNAQKDLLPVFGDETAKGTFMKSMAELAGVKEDDVLAHDLFVYSRSEGTVWGASNEFISCGRLDDLQCAYASMTAFLAAKDSMGIPVHCVYDNEEVGSSTKQGAESTFLLDTLLRICDGLGLTQSDYRRMLASSFMVSADNGHALHPNYTEKACPTNRPYLNGGVVIKYSANQKYTTDAISSAVFKQICAHAEVPYQYYVNRSDILGGSTLGNISGNQVAINTVDIGLPQLAMHSPYETGGAKDTEYLVQAAQSFFECCLRETGAGVYELKW